MDITYTPQITVTIEFTDMEVKILDYARRSPVGVYYDENEFSNPYSISDIVTMHAALRTTLGKTSTGVANYFKGETCKETLNFDTDKNIVKQAELLEEKLRRILRECNEINDMGEL